MDEEMLRDEILTTDNKGQQHRERRDLRDDEDNGKERVRFDATMPVWNIVNLRKFTM